MAMLSHWGYGKGQMEYGSLKRVSFRGIAAFEKIWPNAGV